jgi:hypothetical protein
MKFLNFVDNDTVDTYVGMKKVLKIHPLLEKLRKNFRSAYLPAQDMC